MPDPHIRAAFYLSPTLDALWRWTADGQVLIWPNDTTIAFRGEVEAVLRRLAPTGLPPFGAVALLLAACRDGWPTCVGRETIAGYARVFGNMNVDQASYPQRVIHGAFHNLARDINVLVEQLDKINRLPRGQVDGISAKALLAETVFEGAQNLLSLEESSEIIRAIDEGISPESLRPQLSHEESLAQFARQVDGLTEGLKRVNGEMLSRRAKTGLDEPVNPPQEDLAPPDAVRRLLAELRADEELAGMARLAQNLMAAVNVPRTLRAREDLFVGGVSDLSNRGSLDRLLISELAHDDLTLAVRVAMNEALYLRRESPPREPPHRRAILIDAGIRMWGTPRVFATAVALALAATSDPHAELSVFRATRKMVDAVDLTSRCGIDAHLGVLESSPHPGAALEAFIAETTKDDAAHTDAIVITHADVLADPDFLGYLLASAAPAIYVAAVDRDGSFTLLVFTKAGRKLIREAKLSLDVILNDQPLRRKTHGGLPLINDQLERDLPAIFYAASFPFFLPHIANARRAAASANHGLIAVTRDGRLLHWRDGQHGGKQLTSEVPRGMIRYATMDSAGAILVITHRAEPQSNILIADIAQGTCRNLTIKLSQDHLVGVCVLKHSVYFIHAERVEGFWLGDGSSNGTLPIPKGTQWNRERFFRDAAGFLALARTGAAELTLERIPSRPSEQFPFVPARAIAAFDRDDVEGIWSIIRRGNILDPHGRLFGAQVPEGDFRGISADGHRVAFESPAGKWIVDLANGGAHRRVTGSLAEHLLVPNILWSTCSTVHPRNAFQGIYVDPTLRICLLTKDCKVVSLAFDAQGNLRLADLGRLTKPPERMRQFSEPRRTVNGRMKLSVAGWEDGSKAWLDLRGMLHLKSSDAAVPEISITLTNANCAICSSEGMTSGPEYFFGEIRLNQSALFERLLRSFAERLR